MKPLNIVMQRLPRPDDFDGVWEPRIPEYNPRENAGMDFSCATDVQSHYCGGLFHHTAIVRTGVRIALPRGYHMRVASRSGLGIKSGILAFPGTLDNSYRGEILIRLDQMSDDPKGFSFKAGDRIAQGILFEIPEHIYLIEGEVSTDDTTRGEKGFGSSGL
jgi:dUTP pyrophosphatase